MRTRGFAALGLPRCAFIEVSQSYACIPGIAPPGGVGSVMDPVPAWPRLAGGKISGCGIKGPGQIEFGP